MDSIRRVTKETGNGASFVDSRAITDETNSALCIALNRDVIGIRTVTRVEIKNDPRYQEDIDIMFAELDAYINDKEKVTLRLIDTENRKTYEIQLDCTSTERRSGPGKAFIYDQSTGTTITYNKVYQQVRDKEVSKKERLTSH